jgi:hypothetical protein
VLSFDFSETMVTTESHHLDMQKPQTFSSEQFQQMECDLSDDLEESDAQSGTRYDKTEMDRMGKTQEMKVRKRIVHVPRIHGRLTKDNLL